MDRSRLNSFLRNFLELSAVVAILFLALAVVDGSLFFAYFQVDDFNWLRLAHWQSVLASFHGPWGHGIAYRPISRLSFYLDYRAFGWRAGYWHAENLAIDALAGGCLYRFARCLFLERLPSGIVALLFVISPLGSENVEWISGRDGLLCLVFLLLAMLCWMRGGFSNRGLWILTALLYILAMMTYEPAVVLPLLLLCLTPHLNARRNVPFAQPFVSVALLIVVGTVFWLFRASMLGTAGTDVDPFYGSIWTAVSSNSVAMFHTFRAAWGSICLATLAAMALLGLQDRDTRSRAIALIGLAAILYLPYLTVIGVAPRFLFMAQAPLCMLVVLPWERHRGASRNVLVTAALVMILAFGRVSYRRASSMARASNVGRATLDQIARVESAGTSNVVVDDYPDMAFGSPVMSFYFETAVRARLGSDAPVLARSLIVLSSPPLLHAALTEPTRFFKYNAATRNLDEMDRSAWITRHAKEIRDAGEDLYLASKLRNPIR